MATKKTFFDHEMMHEDFLLIREGIRNKSITVSEAKVLSNNTGKAIAMGSSKLKAAIELGALQEIPELGITDNMLANVVRGK